MARHTCRGIGSQRTANTPRARRIDSLFPLAPDGTVFADARWGATHGPTVVCECVRSVLPAPLPARCPCVRDGRPVHRSLSS
jgi:hypothetical protein